MNLSIAKSRAQSGKTGMLYPKLRSRNITCREGRRRSGVLAKPRTDSITDKTSLKLVFLFDLKYCLFGNNATEITYTISFMAII